MLAVRNRCSPHGPDPRDARERRLRPPALRADRGRPADVRHLPRRVPRDRGRPGRDRRRGAADHRRVAGRPRARTADDRLDLRRVRPPTPAPGRTQPPTSSSPSRSRVATNITVFTGLRFVQGFSAAAGDGPVDGDRPRPVRGARGLEGDGPPHARRRCRADPRPDHRRAAAALRLVAPDLRVPGRRRRGPARRLDRSRSRRACRRSCVAPGGTLGALRTYRDLLTRPAVPRPRAHVRRSTWARCSPTSRPRRSCSRTATA